MPSVIISKDSHFHDVYSLGETTHIGRSPGNDVMLDADGVSRKHARIDQTADGYFLIDEGSTNGTFIEAQRVHRHPLTHGTSFRIHDFIFTFVFGGTAQDEGSADTAATAKKATKRAVEKPTRLVKPTDLKPEPVEKFTRLLKMVDDLHAAPADSNIGDLILAALLEITGAGRGILARLEADGLTTTHLSGFDPPKEPPKAILTIMLKVLDEGTCVHCRYAAKEEIMGDVVPLNLKSVLSIPLLDGNQTSGCLYLDHPEFSGVFSESDRDLVLAAAEHIAEALIVDKPATGALGREEERFARGLKAEGIIARSPKTLKVFQDTRQIARYNVAVLIYGETGTGKEIIARYIHARSGRAGKFIACNCSAIAASMFESELFGHGKGAFTGAAERKPGLLELADKGTLFLDEIGDMPGEQQSKLLRVLQEQEVWRVGGRAPVAIDVRVISATHKDIKNRREELQFRDDLYYRLANVEITAPSLKERTEDIGPLARLMLEEIGAQHMDGRKVLSISPKALRLLEAHDWPGNIRELRNTLFQIAYRCDGDTIQKRHLKDLVDVFEASTKAGDGPISPLVDVERAHIIKALKHTKWNKSAAAKVLQIDRNRLSRRLKKLGIKEPTQ
jgi:DNA-binding NtrC family response regulator